MKKQAMGTGVDVRGGWLGQAFLRYGAILMVLVCGLAETVKGELLVSQYVVAQSPITDEFGALLKGNSISAPAFGFTHYEPEVVQILLATDGTIHPPAPDGTPHPNNVILKTAGIGWGISPAIGESGLFSTAAPRPAHGSKIFARVFNSANLAEATFYGDSELYAVNNTQFEVFEADVGSTDIPLDPTDSDGDGVSDTWEEAFGEDTDGDGLSNGEEIAAGTDLNDPASALEFLAAVPYVQNGLVFEWQSVPGRTYVIEVVSF